MFNDGRRNTIYNARWISRQQFEMEYSMIPGSFIFKRISDDWLVSKLAAVLFSASSLLIIAVTLIWFGYVKIPATAVWGNVLLGILGVFGTLSVFFLWAGMWRYWMRIDASTRGSKRLWFCVLLLGFWYGAILYFFFKYLLADKSGCFSVAGGHQ